MDSTKIYADFMKVWEPAYTWLCGPVYLDARTQDWPLMGWKIPFAMFLAYVIGIPLGVAFMRNREPCKIKTCATLHNLVLFSLSVYMAVETARQAYINFGWGQTGFSLTCNPNDPLSPDGGTTFSPSGRALANVMYVHYLSKAYEFVDTFIMILKKNNRQITFLHVYHHATTFFPVWWAVMNYGPGGEGWFTAFLNSAIHVLMYGYYLASTCGLKLPFFKPLITMSQMTQFCFFIFQGTRDLYLDCYTPRLPLLLLVFQCAVFLTLFTNFFVRSYLVSKPKTKAA